MTDLRPDQPHEPEVPEAVDVPKAPDTADAPETAGAPDTAEAPTPAEPAGGRPHAVAEDEDAAPAVDADEDPRSREELLAELVEAEARRDEYLEDVRRARAEFENYRKRVMREGAAQRDGGRAEVAAALLEVLDDLDRTLEAASSSEDEQLAKGVQLVADKLTGTLRGLGLERIDEVAVLFDPTRHEAVQHRPAGEPVGQPVVAEVFRPGYRIADRILRPAMVVVEE